MKYRLIEVEIEGQGSVSRGVIPSFYSRPIRIIDYNAPIPNGFWDINTLHHWDTIGRDYAINTLNLDEIFIKNRLKETALAHLVESIAVVDDPDSTSPYDNLIVRVGENAVGDFEPYKGSVALYGNNTWTFISDLDALIFLYQDEEDRKTLIQHQIGSVQYMAWFFDINTIIELQAPYHAIATKRRYSRVRWVSSFIVSEFPLYANAVLGSILNTPVGNLYWNYAELGVTGTVEDATTDRGMPMPGLIDFIVSRSIFTDAGLAELDFIPTTSSMSKSDVVQTIYDHLVEGIKPSNATSFQ